MCLKLFDKLGGKDKGRLSQEEYKKNLARALKPYVDNANNDEASSGDEDQDAYGEDYEGEETGNESEQVHQENGNKEINSHGEL